MAQAGSGSRVAGLVLAAGSGSRLGRPKALLRLGDELLLDRAVRTLRQAGCTPVVVVLGAAAEQVVAAMAARPAGPGADDPDVEVVPNAAWATGMGSSLRAGLAALSGRADAAVVSLVDQPGVTAATVQRLVAAWHADARAAVATYDGAPRNPVLLPAPTWAQVTASAVGDRGARAWLRAHPGQVSQVACDDIGSAEDIDTPDDLRRVRNRLTGGSS